MVTSDGTDVLVERRARRNLVVELSSDASSLLTLRVQIKKSGCTVLLVQKSILRDAFNDLSIHFLAKVCQPFQAFNHDVFAACYVGSRQNWEYVMALPEHLVPRFFLSRYEMFKACCIDGKREQRACCMIFTIVYFSVSSDPGIDLLSR